MNSELLLEIMEDNNDNIKTLSSRLKMTRQTLSLKIDGIADFKLNEVKQIAKIYQLNTNKIMEIFFAQ